MQWMQHRKSGLIMSCFVLLRQFDQNSSPFGIPDNKPQTNPRQTEVKQGVSISLSQKPAEIAVKAVEGPKILQEIGEGNELCHPHNRCGKHGDRIVDPADQQHQAYQGPCSNLGLVSEDQNQDTDGNAYQG